MRIVGHKGWPTVPLLNLPRKNKGQDDTFIAGAWAHKSWPVVILPFDPSNRGSWILWRSLLSDTFPLRNFINLEEEEELMGISTQHGGSMTPSLTPHRVMEISITPHRPLPLNGLKPSRVER